MGDKTDKEAYAKGLVAIEAFFKQAGPDFKYIGTDYKYKGLLLLKTGKDSLAKIELEKAISLEPKLKSEIYTELAVNAMKAKKHSDCSHYYELKYGCDSANFGTNDFFSLGRAYFYTALSFKKEANDLREAQKKKKKPEETTEVLAKESSAKALFIKSDSAFSKTTQKNQAWPIGYFWRARANSYLDPTNALWLAKPYYEKMISLITKPEERTGTYKTNLIEAYEYLGSYYVTTNDKAKADETWTFVKELDPANEKAKNYFTPPKPKPAPAGAPKAN
jgi:hypothetical protein